MDETRNALKEWERRALIIMSLVGIALCLFYAVISIQRPLSGVTPYFSALAVIPMVAVFALALVFVPRGIGTDFFGFAIGMVFAAVFFGYPHLFYQAIGDEDLPLAFTLKTLQPAFGPVLIAFMALTFRPGLTFATAAAIVVLQLVNLWLALGDPRTIVTDDPVTGIMGPAILIPQVAAETAILVIAGVVAVTTAFAVRRTIGRAVAFERANGQLRRYFSPDVAERLADSPQWQELSGGATRDVVILFSDIADFTSLAEGLSPDETVRLLSEYRERMVGEIFANRGTLDKFIGDGILAVFGTFGNTADAADRAIATAHRMCAALVRMNEVRAANGLPPLSHRIGLHAGPALVGNVVSAGRMEFTVIGDTVNVASRIEQAGKALNEAVVISAEVRARATDVARLAPLGTVDLPGRQAPVELYRLAAVEAGPEPAATTDGGGALAERPAFASG